jgi:hypothetical protein
MSTPRRRIVRPAPAPSSQRDRQQQIQKLRLRLEQERVALARWMPRLRRAFRAVEKYQGRLARLERQISKLEAS